VVREEVLVEATVEVLAVVQEEVLEVVQEPVEVLAVVLVED